MESSVIVHGSGTDAFSRRKTNSCHGRISTTKRRLPVKMGLSPSLARERLQSSEEKSASSFTTGSRGIELDWTRADKKPLIESCQMPSASLPVVRFAL